MFHLTTSFFLIGTTCFSFFSDPNSIDSPDFFGAEDTKYNGKDKYDINAQFGHDHEGRTAENNTKFLRNAKKIKLVVHINRQDQVPDHPDKGAYGIGSIENAITDLKLTHAIEDKDFEIVVVIRSGGWPLVLNDKRNPHLEQMLNFVDKYVIAGGSCDDKKGRVRVLFCQNSAAGHDIKFNEMIPGIQFSTAGISTIMDLQLSGYSYFQP